MRLFATAHEQRRRQVETDDVEAARRELHRVTAVAAAEVEHLRAGREVHRVDHELGLGLRRLRRQERQRAQVILVEQIDEPRLAARRLASGLARVTAATAAAAAGFFARRRRGGALCWARRAAAAAVVRARVRRRRGGGRVASTRRRAAPTGCAAPGAERGGGVDGGARAVDDAGAGGVGRRRRGACGAGLTSAILVDVDLELARALGAIGELVDVDIGDRHRLVARTVGADDLDVERRQRPASC